MGRYTLFRWTIILQHIHGIAMSHVAVSATAHGATCSAREALKRLGLRDLKVWQLVRVSRGEEVGP